MDSNRDKARRKGLRMAAQLAAIGGFVAASAAAGWSHADEPAAGAAAEGVSENGKPLANAEDMADVLKVRDMPRLGCVPKWGPPAPPEMRAELLDWIAEVA
jgi:hypothetical protein